MDFPRTVLVAVSKTSDIDIHVSSIDVDGVPYTDIREYIVSLDRYGRGITFPGAFNAEIAAGVLGG